jgi:hypothetical protein
MPHHDKEARAVLTDILDSCETVEHYLDVIWRQRAREKRVSSNGWPFKHSDGVEQPSKLRKVK